MKFSTRKLFYALPPALRFAVRRLRYLPLDTWESLSGQRDDLMPPKGLIFTGGGDFKKTGEKLLGFFQEFGGLKPSGQVLDVGSGIGRVAIPLTKFLNNTGGYEGFDVIEKGVKWCNDNIAARFQNFHFRYIPLENDLYRADGERATQFVFPYENNRFDLAVVNSVFTHLLPEEVDNYLGEIHRVLKPGGVCYATFFLFENEATPHFPKGFDFPFDYGHYRLMDDKVKSANVAFSEKWLRREVIEKYGFQVSHLFYGVWRGLPPSECKEFQDIVLLKKAL